jgi:hypothetical protein
MKAIELLTNSTRYIVKHLVSHLNTMQDKTMFQIEFWLHEIDTMRVGPIDWIVQSSVLIDRNFDQFRLVKPKRRLERFRLVKRRLVRFRLVKRRLVRFRLERRSSEEWTVASLQIPMKWQKFVQYSFWLLNSKKGSIKIQIKYYLLGL